MSESNSPQPSYSTAFETFVQEDNDLVGLIAYALYKAHIREAIRAGRSMDSAARAPTSHMRSAFRGEAEKQLGLFASSIIEQEKPGLIRSEFGKELETTETEIKNFVRIRTGFWSSIVTNIVAWLISIGITALIILNGIPDWAKSLVNITG